MPKIKLNKKSVDLTLEENERLACQCQNIKGDIEIDNPDF